MLRVLVADADPTSRSGWAGLLDAEKDLRVKAAGSRERLYDRAGSADVVVLVTGASSARSVTEIIDAVNERGTPVVALTPASDPGLVAEAIASGAAGAVVADAAPAQVVAAVRAAAEGRRVERETGTIPVTGPLVQTMAHEASPLTSKEIEILALAEQGLSTQEIAGRLYVSASTVKSHLSHAFARLGVRHRAAAVAEARRRGLLG